MARGKLFLIALLFLSACAEVTPLSGGDRDVNAPKPVNGKQTPEQGAIGFNGNQLTVTFNEYFNLVEPSKTIEMNPNCGEISTEQKNKTLSIKWSEPLKPNTTYSIILDGTVVDLTEKNDSIHQFVFSTGLSIDTNKISGKCVDAFSNNLLSNCTIFLFDKEATFTNNKPRFKTRSNKFGQFQFSYLPANTEFKLFAFVDQNKNNSFDLNENKAFLSSLDSSDTTDLSIYFFKEKQAVERLKVAIIEPGIVSLVGNNVLNTKINNQIINSYKSFSQDSILAYLPLADNYEFILEEDTIIKSGKVKISKIAPKLSNSQFRIGDTVFIETNDYIQTVDEFKFTLSKGVDQISFSLDEQKCSFVATEKMTGEVTLTLGKDAINCLHGKSDSSSIAFKVFKESELASLTLKLENFETDVIVELVENNKVVHSMKKSYTNQIVKFERIIPGNYTIRCIEDNNKDGKWTAGSIDQNRQPEKVYYFKLNQKLRGNWEIEQTLQRN